MAHGTWARTGGWLVGHKGGSARVAAGLAVALLGVVLPLLGATTAAPAGAAPALAEPEAPLVATALDVGLRHTCAVTPTGGVRCWGNPNYQSALGTADADPPGPLVDVAGLPAPVVDVATGNEHSCALTDAGAVLCWGQGQFGLLGQGAGNTNQSATPLPVTGLPGPMTDLVAGDAHTCALDADGERWCWGSSAGRRTGTTGGTLGYEPTPVEVPADGAYASIDAGAGGGCGTRDDGEVHCWGTAMTTPDPGSTFASISTGTATTCGVTAAGSALCWGERAGGMTGSADGVTTNGKTPTPRQVTDLTSGVASVSVGPTSACAVLTDGTVQCWGAGAGGQLGSPRPGTSTRPVEVPGLTDIVSVAVGSLHTCAIAADGVVSCWGGGLGLGRSVDAAVVGWPTPVGLPSGQAGRFRGPEGWECDLTAAGQATCTGNQALAGVTHAASGHRFSCLRTSTGAVHCLGRNEVGQVGNGTTGISSGLALALPSGAATVVTGTEHSCALMSSGGASCWGDGIANGTSGISVVTPTTVPGLEADVTALAAGGDSSCAVVAGGQVRCWGRNSRGSLGAGHTGSSTSPVPVLGLPGPAVSVAVGWFGACAVVDGGEVWCWGDDSRGGLGDGGDRAPGPLVPRAVELPFAATSVVAGGERACALDADGVGWCWGGSSAGSGLSHDVTAPRRIGGPGITSLVPDPQGGCLVIAAVVSCWGHETTGLGNPGWEHAPVAPTPAMIGARVSPAPYYPPAWYTTGGWYTSPPTVRFHCASTVAAPTSCSAPVVVGDGFDQSVTGTVVAGDVTETVTVRGINVDSTPPTIVPVYSPAATTDGWHNDDVTVTWQCADATSGVATCPAPQQVGVGATGTGLTVSAVATDNLGLAATGTATVKIDRENPSTWHDDVPVWSDEPYDLLLESEDDLSGVATTHYRVDDGPVQTGTSVPVEQGFHKIEYWSVDRAGNTEPPHESLLGVASGLPTITAEVSPAPNAAGWNKGPVTVTFTCTDGEEVAVSSCSDPVAVTEETAGRTITGTVVGENGADRTTSVVVRLDQTAPTVTPSVPAPDGAAGWRRTPTSVTFACADDSGVVACPATIEVPEGTLPASTATVTDVAGNTGTAPVPAIKVDTVAPAVAVVGPTDGATYLFGSVPGISCSATDATSGVATAPTLSVTPFDGTQAHTVTATCAGAVDVAGHPGATVAVTFTVVPAHTVRGTVRDAVSGLPVAGAQVRLYSRPYVGSDSTILRATTTDSLGRYVITGVHSGTVHPFAGRSGSHYTAFAAPLALQPTIDEGQPVALDAAVELAIAPIGGATATVTGPDGPVSGATVRLFRGGVATATRVVTGADGTAAFTGLTPGTYQLRTVALGYEPHLTGSFTVVTGSPVTFPAIALTAAPATSGMTGTLRTTGGAPHPVGHVRAFLVDSALTSAVANVPVAADGTWTIPSLPAGTYRLQYARAGHSSTYDPTYVTLTPGPPPHIDGVL